MVGRRPPRIRLPHNLLLPVAAIAEGWARLTGLGQPMVTLDGVRLSKKKMFFTYAKAKRELGYAPRPVTEALREAIAWFRQFGTCP